MNQNETDQPMEVLPPSAIMAMERAQIDTQVSTAHQYPRSMEQFRKRALSMVTLDEETAESCTYCRPVGKEQNDKGQWVQKFAEGPSIRLAEIVAASYGNIRIAARVIEQTDRFVRCEGVAHDLESNYAGKSECIESTVDKNGKPYSERQRALMAKVCLAKAYRDAAFKVVPRSLCKPIQQAAQKVASGADKPLEERRKKAQAWIGSLKINEARVFAALGVNGWSEVTSEHLITLTGIKTAMADGDETIDSAFPPIEASHKPELPAKLPQTVSGAPKTPATPQKPASEPPASAQAPADAPPAPSDEAEAAAGLAPSTNETQVSAAPATQAGQGPTTPPAPAGAATTKNDPSTFKPNNGESIPLTSVRRWLHQEGRTEQELLKVLVANKASKPGQRLLELSDSKLDNCYKARATLLTQMAQQPQQKPE